MPLATSIKDTLLDDVTTLLAKQAAKKMMDDQKEENKFNAIKQAIEVTLVDQIATFLSKTAVEKFFDDEKKKEATDTKKILEEYSLFADSVKQDMFRGSSNEMYLLEEFRENGEEHNLVDSEELLTDRKSPILYSISNMDLQSDRVQEKKMPTSFQKNPTGKGKVSFSIPNGKNPTDWEIVSSSFGVAEKTVNGQDRQIDPSMDFIERAIDIVGLIENKD